MEIVIGEISIKPMNNGNYWMENSNREGTEITKHLLEVEMKELFNRMM